MTYRDYFNQRFGVNTTPKPQPKTPTKLRGAITYKKIVSMIIDADARKEFDALIRCFLYMRNKCPKAPSLGDIVEGVDRILKNWSRCPWLLGLQVCLSLAAEYDRKHNK